MNVTISGNSSSSRQVALSRRNSQIIFTTTDNIPDNITKCHLTVANHKSLLATLIGSSAYTHEATLDISSYQGRTYSVFVNTLTEAVSDEEDCDVMIEFLDENNSVLYHYERTIKLKSNRKTTLTGNFFSDDSNTVSIIEDWEEGVTTPLFNDEV